MMYVCVFCFAVWTASLDLNLDFRRDATIRESILSAFSTLRRLHFSAASIPTIKLIITVLGLGLDNLIYKSIASKLALR